MMTGYIDSKPSLHEVMELIRQNEWDNIHFKPVIQMQWETR